MFNIILIVLKSYNKVKGEEMKTEKNIFIAFILNLLFSIVEVVGGIFTGSIAIISDAVHDFGDAVSIGLSYLFEKISKRKPDKVYTYGYVRYSVLGGVITILILTIGSLIVIYNAINRLFNPILIEYDSMIILAIIGLVVNFLATYFTHGGHSINQKAVNLHMIEDLLGWAIILIGAVVMKFTNFYVLDGILSILVAIFVLFNAIKSLGEILDMFLLKVPKKIEVGQLKEHVLELDGVLDVHHFHAWSLDGENCIATLHVVVNNYDENIKNQVKAELNEHGVLHATVEIETVSEKCLEKECVIKHEHNHCHHHH